MKDKELISIIIPVYKVEKYISRCVQSVIEQTYTNWELLLVDDGTPDNSGQICDNWALIDARIKVFHKGNGGVSSARNLGLDNIKGHWITFIDSDDWIEKDCLEHCFAVIEREKLDILQFCFQEIDSKGVVKSYTKKSTPTLPKDRFVRTNLFNVCVWGGIIKSSIIKDNHIKFQEGIKLAEDQMFIMECISNADLLKVISNPFYNYFMNEDSAVHNAKTIDMLQSIEALQRFKINYPIFSNQIAKQINSFCKSIVVNGDIDLKLILNIYEIPMSSQSCMTSLLDKLFDDGIKQKSIIKLYIYGAIMRFKYLVRSVVIFTRNKF